MKNMKRTKILSLLLIGSFLFGCTSENSTRKRSFSDQDFNSQDSIVLTQASSAEALRLEQILLVVEPILESQISLDKNKIDIGLLFAKIITPLRESILNKDYLLNPDNIYARSESGQALVPRIVSIFNEALLLVAKADIMRITETTLLLDYKNTLLWDCDDNLQGSCEVIKIFRYMDSVNIGQIVKLIHDQEKSEVQKMRLVRAAFDLKNRRLDASLRLMLLERVTVSIAQERDNRISSDRLKQDADLFANLFKINISEMNVDLKYQTIINALNPWTLSRNVDDTKNPAMSDIIKIASSQLLYKNGQLTKEMKSAINELHYAIGPQFEQGVEFQKENILGEWKARVEQYKRDLADGKDVKQSLCSTESIAKLRSTYVTLSQAEVCNKIELITKSLMNALEMELYGPESKKIIGNMLKDVSFIKDEYFFLAHQVYYGHYNIEDASAFWSGTKKDQKRLMKATIDLIKSQIVNNIVYTNTRMNKFYNKNENSKIIELLREAEKEGTRVRKIWTKTIVRSKSIKNFIVRVIDGNKQENKEEFNIISSSVDALTKNIKFLVTYPNMFPLLHVMASLEMRDTVQSFFGTFTIDSQSIIDFFFTGRFPPWFNFGNDGSPLDPTEIVYAYYYALNTEIFETYSTNQIVKFNNEEFLKVVAKKLLLSIEKELDEERRFLSEKIEKYKNNSSAMQRMCQEEMALQKQEGQILEIAKQSPGFDWVKDFKGVMKRRTQIKNQVAFTDLPIAIYDPTNIKENKLGQYIRTIYSEKNKNVFESMRTELQKKTLLAKTLLDVYKINSNKSEHEVDELFNSQFDEYKRLRAEFTALYFAAEKQIEGCEWAFINRDRDIRHAIVFKEVEFLNSIFDKVWNSLSGLTDDQRANLSEEKKQELEAILIEHSTYTQSNKYPSDYQERRGYNALTASRFTSFKMDATARLAAHLEELFPGEFNITMPSDFKVISLYQETEPGLVYFDWSIKDKEKAKRAFVNSGARAFGNMFPWSKGTMNVSDIEVKGDILINLFKLKRLSINDEIDCSATTSASIEQIKASCVSVSAKKVIEYFKQLINFVNIDERDEIILSLMGLEGLYSQGTYENLIKKKNEHKLYSYYDLIFKRIYSDAKVSDPETFWFSGTLRAYVDSVHKRRGSTFIFAYSDQIEEIYKKNYSTWINDYYSLNTEFLKEVKSQLSKGVEPVAYKYRANKVEMIAQASNINGDDQKNHLEPLISDLIYGKFEGMTQELDNSTSGYFSNILKQQKTDLSNLVKRVGE